MAIIIMTWMAPRHHSIVTVDAVLRPLAKVEITDNKAVMTIMTVLAVKEAHQ